MPSKGRTIVTDLFSVTRLNNSTNGNPRYELHTSDGNYRTQSDAACAYDVANIVRTIPHGETIPVTLHTTPAGRVWNIEVTCRTCGERLTRDWGGWSHVRKPARRHVVKV